MFVRAVRAGEAKLRGRARESVLWLRRGRTKSIPSGRPVARGCPAGVPPVSPVAEARPDQKYPFRAAGAPRVSRRCPAGVPMMMMMMMMMVVSR